MKNFRSCRILVNDMSRGKYGKQYEFKGKLYFATEIEKKFGIKFNTFLRRIDRGMTVEEAISMPLQNNTKYVMYHGRYVTKKQLAETVGVTLSALNARVRKYKCTYEQAADMPKSARGSIGRRIVVDGRTIYDAKPRRFVEGCVYPDCFHCKLKDCMVD